MEKSDSKNKNIEEVRALLEKNPKALSDLVNSDSQESNAPLWEAMLDESEKIVELLKELKVDLDEISILDEKTKKTVPFFHWLAAAPNWESKRKIAEVLIKLGADVDVKNKDGDLPLFVAVFNGNEKCAEFLNENDASLGDCTKIIKKLLKNPKMKDRTKILKSCVKYDLDLFDYWGSKGETLLNTISKLRDDYEDVAEMAKIIADAQSDEEKYDKHGDEDGNTALHNAVSKKNPNLELVSVLITKGAWSIHKKTYCSEGKFPLMLAVQHDNVDLIDLLISHGARVNDKTDGSHMTALHGACMCCNEKVIKFLIQKGADISPVNDWGSTPFSILMENPQLENRENCIRTMIKEFAKRSTTNCTILKKDMKLINSNAMAKEYFESCLAELKQMVSPELYFPCTYDCNY